MFLWRFTAIAVCLLSAGAVSGEFDTPRNVKESGRRGGVADHEGRGPNGEIKPPPGSAPAPIKKKRGGGGHDGGRGPNGEIKPEPARSPKDDGKKKELTLEELQEKLPSLDAFNTEPEKRTRRIILFRKDSGADNFAVTLPVDVSEKALWGTVKNRRDERKQARGYSSVMIMTMESGEPLPKPDKSTYLLVDYQPRAVVGRKLIDGAPAKHEEVLHTFMCEFKPEEQVETFVNLYAGLSQKIREMMAFEWGIIKNPGNSGNSTYKYVFTTTFNKPEDRDQYLENRNYVSFLRTVEPNLKSFLVVDFQPFAHLAKSEL